MALFAQFLLRLAFGLAACMATVSPKLVSSGYFRNHLYVTLGLAAMAALAGGTIDRSVTLWAILAAAASYAGAVGWLYEKHGFGQWMLALVAFAAWGAASTLADVEAVQRLEAARPNDAESVEFSDPSAAHPPLATLVRKANLATSGLLLGAVTASMLLGHWYLNSPGMKIEPLQKLIRLIGWLVFVQAILAGVAAWYEFHGEVRFDLATWAMFAIRWGFGLVGVAVLAWMAAKTLEIPNTQSATGILYVAVLGAFTGEVMSLLLAAERAYPL